MDGISSVALEFEESCLFRVRGNGMLKRGGLKFIFRRSSVRREESQPVAGITDWMGLMSEVSCRLNDDFSMGRVKLFD